MRYDEEACYPDDLSMSTSLFERSYGTAPHPSDWYVWRISLDSYSANIWGSSDVSGIIVYPHR